MKTRYIVILVSISVICANSQDTLKIRDIYDYNTGDEFQFKLLDGISAPPHITRYTVQEKFYSTLLDTVFYVLHFDNYSTEYFPDPSPHLEYSFNSYIDTVHYSNLDSSVYYPYAYDTLIYDFDTISGPWSKLCNTPFVGYDIYNCDEIGWHCHVEKERFSKGLGRIYYESYYTAEPWTGLYGFELFYYKKGSSSCGTPDLTTDLIQYQTQHSLVIVFPNPAKDFITIQLNQTIHVNSIRIYSSNLALCKTVNADELIQISIEDLQPGLYFIEIETSESRYAEKFIKY